MKLDREFNEKDQMANFSIFATSGWPRQKLFAKNIARGTTDPEIESVTWIKLGNNMAPHTLVANLANRWRHLH